MNGEDIVRARNGTHPPNGVEAALHLPPPFRVRTIAVLPEDKALFDEVLSWYEWQAGRKFTQPELFQLLLLESIGNGERRFERFRSAS